MTVFISVAAASTNLVVSFILLIVELHNRREIRRVSCYDEAHDGTDSLDRNVPENNSL